MASGWSLSGDAIRVYGEEDFAAEYKELYERARKATRAAQREGDAQLKAALAKANAATGDGDSIHMSLISPTFDNRGPEMAYRPPQANCICNFKDIVPFTFELLLQISLILLFFHISYDHRTEPCQEKLKWLQYLNPFTRLFSYLWNAAICAAVLAISFCFSRWYQENRPTILLVVACALWIGEGITVFAASPKSRRDLSLLLVQCVYMSILHRAPFCLHLKARVFGIGLQILGMLAKESVSQVTLALVFLGFGHSLGVVLAYVIDQQSKAAFLQSFPSVALHKAGSAGGSLSCQREIPRRALGGFAGGFGGVSSLKCAYTSSIWAVSSASHVSGSLREVSCDSSSTVENLSQDHLSCWHSSLEDEAPSSSSCNRSVFECGMYWRIRAGLHAHIT